MAAEVNEGVEPAHTAASNYHCADELAALSAPGIKDLLRETGARSGGFAGFALI